MALFVTQHSIIGNFNLQIRQIICFKSPICLLIFDELRISNQRRTIWGRLYLDAPGYINFDHLLGSSLVFLFHLMSLGNPISFPLQSMHLRNLAFFLEPVAISHLLNY